MATTTISAQRKALRSTVATKVVMAVSGLAMIGYLIAHMAGNLKAFQGQATFDEYAHHLRVLGEPILPESSALWVFRIGLLVAVFAHIISAIRLSRRSWGAAGVNRYKTTKHRTGIQRSYASFTLRSGGVVIAAFVVYHLAHFTWQFVTPGGAPTDSPFERLTNGFSVWWVVLIYTIALIAVGFHLRHGTGSALYTLGFGQTAASRRIIQIVSVALAWVIFLGFLAVPVSVLIGVIPS